MNITEVRIKLGEEPTNPSYRLRAFANITIDDAFAVRDLKVVDGTKGLFVAMPGRKLMDRCQRCRTKNHLLARYCNACGSRLADNRAEGVLRLHADIAHPINSDTRLYIEDVVLDAYQDEIDNAPIEPQTCNEDYERSPEVLGEEPFGSGIDLPDDLDFVDRRDE